MKEKKTAFPYVFECLTEDQLTNVKLTKTEKNEIQEGVFVADTNQARQRKRRAANGGEKPTGTKRVKKEPTEMKGDNDNNDAMDGDELDA